MNITEKFFSITGEPEESEILNLTYGLQNLTQTQQQQVENLLKEYIGFNKVVWMTLPVDLVTNRLGEKTFISSLTKLINHITPIEEYKDETCYLYQILYTPSFYEPDNIKAQRKVMLRFGLDDTEN